MVDVPRMIVSGRHEGGTLTAPGNMQRGNEDQVHIYAYSSSVLD